MAFSLDVLPVFGVLGVMIVTTELPSSVRLELPSSVRLELESRGSVGRNPSPPGDGATVAKDPLWGVIRSGEARSIIPAYSLVNPPGGFPILGLEYATPRVPRVILRSSTPAQTLRLHFNRKPIVSRESTFYLYEVKVESRFSRNGPVNLGRRRVPYGSEILNPIPRQEYKQVVVAGGSFVPVVLVVLKFDL